MIFLDVGWPINVALCTDLYSCQQWQRFTWENMTSDWNISDRNVVFISTVFIYSYVGYKSSMLTWIQEQLSSCTNNISISQYKRLIFQSKSPIFPKCYLREVLKKFMEFSIGGKCDEDILSLSWLCLNQTDLKSYFFIRGQLHHLFLLTVPSLLSWSKYCRSVDTDILSTEGYQVQINWRRSLILDNNCQFSYLGKFVITFC